MVKLGESFEETRKKNRQEVGERKVGESAKVLGCWSAGVS